MKRYYFCPIMGSGRYEDEWRPKVAIYTNVFGMIQIGNRALACADTPTPILDTEITLLTEDVTESLSALRLSKLGNLLGITLDATKLSDIAYELFVGKALRLGLNPLRPEPDGKIRIYLGGQIYGPPPPTYTHKTITDTFSGDLSNWTDAGGTWDIASGQLRETELVDAYLRHNTNLAGDDHYSQITAISSGHTYRYHAVLVRQSTANVSCYNFQVRTQGTTRRILRISTTGGATVLASDASFGGYPAVIKLQAVSDALTSWEDAVQALTATDATYTTRPNVGVAAAAGSAAGNLFDNFEADDVGAGGIPVPVAIYHQRYHNKAV